MNPLSVVLRELRKAGRSRGTYLLRGVCLLLLVGVVFLVWWGEIGDRNLANFRAISQAGRQLYVTYFLLVGCLSALVCPILTCGAIADETEDRTLEVLLTAPLRRYGIVLAKFTSRMAYAFMLFLASIPVLIGCLVFGGVAPQELLTSGALLLALSIWAGAITLLFSTVVRKGYAAALLAYVAIAAWSFGVPLLWLALTGFPGAPSPTMLVLAPPFYYGFHVTGELDRILGGASYAWECVGVLLGSSALALGISARLLGRRLFRAQPRESADVRETPQGSARRLARWTLLLLASVCLVLLALWGILPSRHWEGIAAVPARFALCLAVLVCALCHTVRELFSRGRGYRAVWENGFLWKEIALPGSLSGRVTVAVATAGLAFIGILVMHGRHAARDDDVCMGVTLTLFITMTLIAAVVGGASITSEREQGLLDLLLVTPSPSHRIFDGKLVGTLAHMAPLWAFYALYVLIDMAQGVLDLPVQAALAFALVAASLCFQTVVSCACSLVFRKSTIAILVALAVPIVACGVWPLAYFLVWDVFWSGEPRGIHLLPLFQCNPFYFFCGLMQNRLHHEFRTFPIGFYPGLVLNFALIVAGAAALRLWVVRRLRRLSRA